MRKINFEIGRTVLLAVCVMVGAASAWCAGPPPQSDTFYTTRTPRISLTNVTGTIIIRGWDKPQVHAVYFVASPRIEIDKEQMPPRGEADKIQLVTHVLDRSLQGPASRVDYTLDVPAGASLEIRNPQGTVRIDSLSGDTWVRSVGGGIFVSGVTGQINASSLGGEIEIDRSSGEIETSSVTGNLKFVSNTSTEIHGTSASGGITYEGNLAPLGDYVMQTYNGPISFLIPPSSSFEVRAVCRHCKVVNQLKLNRSNSHSPYGESLFGVRNQGRATLSLQSFSGTIRISPQPDPPQQ